MFLVSRHFGTSVDGVDRYSVGSTNGTLPLKLSTLFFFAKIQCLPSNLHTLCLESCIFVNIHLDIVHGNTVFGKVMNSIVIVVTALERTLAKCNPRSSTCRPKRPAHFDTGRL
jgi:hypothetical protein